MTDTRLWLLPCFFLLLVGKGIAEEPVLVTDADVNVPFSWQIEIDGGTAPYVYELDDGTALPPGLALDKNSGIISGTPTRTQRAPFTFVVKISDDSEKKQTVKQLFALKVQPAPLRVVGSTPLVRVVGNVAPPLPSPSLLARVAAPDPQTPPATPASDPAAPAPTSMAKAATPDPQAIAPASKKPAADPAPKQPAPADPSTQPATNNGTTATDTNAEWEARAIAGYHQAGASSAKSTQNFFFDFFIDRALSSTHLWGPYNTDKKGALLDANPMDPFGKRWSLWGDVRIASAPQQVTSGVGTFVSTFGTQLSNVPVNQLAESADFETGLEFRLHTFVRDPTGTYVLGYRTLGLVTYFGAMGSFEPPSSQMQIFNVPMKTSPQYALFAQQFPTAANAMYVGFVPPDRQRFYRNYGVGFRVTTFDRAQPLAPPGTYTFTVGQDESITGGIFRSVVGRFEVFYPLPTPTSKGGSTSAAGGYKFLYLFGTANLRFSKAVNIPVFGLQNPNAQSTVIQPYDPNLAVVEVPSTRDTYRIGVGVDLVNLMQSISATANGGKTAPPAAAAATK